MDINTSLLREKFIIIEKHADPSGKALNITCPSTRMSIDLQAGDLQAETYIVRTNNMHTCIRIISKIISDYEKSGPIMNRAVKVNWEEIWNDSLNYYERKYNTSRWISIYHKGKTIFSQGQYHPFFDVIEKCDMVNKASYASSIKLAEDSFAKAGKEINLTYNGNIALVSVLNNEHGRCSMILRGNIKNNTFNYVIKPKEKDQKINISQILTSAADFLEGVHLSYLIGTNNVKIDNGDIEKYSEEYVQTQKAKERINQLYAQIHIMENRYKVRYRPERPDFNDIIDISEKRAHELSHQ